MKVEEGFYYNVCHCSQTITKRAHLRGKITTTSEVVTIFLEGQWLETLVRMSEEIFLNLSRQEQIRMLTSFRIKGTFWLIPMSFMNGFDEDMETNFTSIHTLEANRDSTQNSVASQIEDIGTPSQNRKLEFCDIIEDSPGSTSSSKSRKI